MVSLSSCTAMMKRHASGPRLRRIWLAATIAVPLFAAVILPAGASELTEQGQDIAQRLCSTCHGIGRAERSPMAAAPAFRRIEPRVDLDRMIERLQRLLESQRQLLACRLSHLLGLVAVLTLLLILGWTPASDLAGQVSGLLAR